MNQSSTSTFDQKVKDVFSWFNVCRTQDEVYKKIIEIGRGRGEMDASEKTENNLVIGCQSRMYLSTLCKEGALFFETSSDALISSGLSVLLTHVYSGEAAEVILTKQPDYLEELGITKSLTPNRANGLYSLHLRMKQEALKSIVAT